MTFKNGGWLLREIMLQPVLHFPSKILPFLTVITTSAEQVTDIKKN